MEAILLIAVIVMFFLNFMTVFFSNFISHAANAVFSFLVGLQFVFYPNQGFGLGAGALMIAFSFVEMVFAYRAKKQAGSEKEQNSKPM